MTEKTIPANLEAPYSLPFGDEGVIVIRPVQPEDAEALQTMHQRLSKRTIYSRYMSQAKRLSEAALASLTDIDFQNRMGLVAELIRNDAEDTSDENAEPYLIGIASYAVSKQAADIAEAAVLVEDAYQRRGIGTALLTRLAWYAKAHGIRAFLANIQLQNEPILRFIQRSGLPVEREISGGVWDGLILLEGLTEE